MKKSWVLSSFTPKHSVLPRTIYVFGFWGQPGDLDDDIEHIEFLIFLPPKFMTRKGEFRSRRFVCTGSELFPKHSVSRRREERFQLQESRGGPPGGRGRSGHTCPWAKSAHLEFVKEFGIWVKVLDFIGF